MSSVFYTLVAIAAVVGFLLGYVGYRVWSILPLAIFFVALSFAGIVTGRWPVPQGLWTAFFTCVVSQTLFMLGSKFRS